MTPESEAGGHGKCFLVLEPGLEQWPCVLHGWDGSSIPQEQRTSGEDTVGRLGLVSWYIVPVSVAPRSSATTEQARENGLFLQHSGA